MRYFIGVIIIVFIFLLGLILIFSHHSKKPANTGAPVVLPLPQYASTDATVSLTIDGRINGDDAHRAIKITIGRDERSLDIIQGYSGNVISSNNTYNSQDAYSVFLKALNLSGYELTKKSTTGADPAGYCPDGIRYIYTLTKNGNNLVNTWDTNCNTTWGNFGGNAAQVIDLFENQITNYESLTSDVAL